PSTSCASGANVFCANSFLLLLPPTLDNFVILTPPAVDLDGTQIPVGFGGATFTIKFRVTDPNNAPLTGCIPKLADTILSLSTTISEVDSSDTTTNDGKFYICSFSIPFTPPVNNSNLGISKGYLFLAGQVGGVITTSFFNTGKIIAVKNNNPELINGSVSPLSGNPGDSFTFFVTYKDKDNHPPAFVRLYIDLNATGSIGNQEVFDMVKQDINCSDFVTGCVYTKSLNNIKAVAGGRVLFGYGTTDGFIDWNLKDFKVTLLPSDFSQQSCRVNNSFSLIINNPGTSLPPTLQILNIPGFTSNNTFGLVEPDSGTPTDDFIFAVKYTSPANISPLFVRMGIFFKTWGQRFINLTRLDSSTISQLPGNISSHISATLYDNNFSNGEVYFLKTKLFDKAVFINGIEADDGTFRVALGGSPDAIIVNIADADGDGVEDSLETGLPSDNSRIVAFPYDILPGTSSRKIVMNVAPAGNLSGSPRFTSVACGDLVNGVGDLGTLAPPDTNLIPIQPLINIKINAGGANTVQVGVQLPEPLPTGGKIFKLLRGKIWDDITNIVNLSADRSSFTITIQDNSEKDFDLTADLISDPIGIFAPSFSSGEGGGTNNEPPDNNNQSSSWATPAGGGCYINPKINNFTSNDFCFLLLLLVSAIGIIIRTIPAIRKSSN
ncbi:MAG: choice-of-anchor U domain-containing protein, partial [Planctomycetota bacterium]